MVSKTERLILVNQKIIMDTLIGQGVEPIDEAIMNQQIKRLSEHLNPKKEAHDFESKI